MGSLRRRTREITKIIILTKYKLHVKVINMFYTRPGIIVIFPRPTTSYKEHHIFIHKINTGIVSWDLNRNKKILRETYPEDDK